jgi:hypothetical protein
MKSCSLSLTICEVGNLCDVGKAELLPRIVTEKEFILPVIKRRLGIFKDKKTR